ncbi:MAG TPA: polysaccharide biosynthesis tyrosine autokinase [Anaerolineales bacterium]|nr:polysaccharide biosynthesis tyrosine autokinase [Anaerolineales bacterium]
MELKVYLRPIIKWWLLLVVAALLAAVASFVVTRQQPPIYESHTTLVSGSAIFESNPTTRDLSLNQQLATFYVELAKREPVRAATMEALNITSLPEYVVRLIPNTQFIEITVSDTDKVRAQAVANELANQLIRLTPSYAEEDQVRQNFINEQLVRLETRITETQDEINLKQSRLSDLSSARAIADAETEIAGLERRLSDLRTDYANLLSNSERGAVNTLTVIEPADLPRRPVGPRASAMVLLSAGAALAIATAAAYLLEYLDDTLKLPDEISRLVGLPVIGYIADVFKEDYLGAYVAKHPRSAVAEAFRALRTDLEFAGVDTPLDTILVASPGMSAGKTSIAINLAIVLAQSGKRVALVDADLRKPSVHRILGLTNHRGLSDVFRGSLEIQHVAINWKDGNLTVVTSGGQPPNPAELLSSKKMNQLLETLKGMVDVVVIDGPPFLVTDATILSTKVDGVVLVFRYGHTRRNEALSAVNQLRRVDAKILGVVLNRIPRAREDLFGMYNYYYREYYAQEGEEIVATQNGKSWLPKVFRRKSEPVLESPNVDDSVD